MFYQAFIVVCASWVAFELWLVAFRRSGATATRKDVGTLKRLNIVIYASVAAAGFLSTRALGHIPLPGPVLWTGLVLIIAGVVLRVWAIRSLHRFFTVDVAIHPDHQLVQSGPYSQVRHPAYSGVLLSFLGLAVCMSNWLSALVLLVPIAAVFLQRVRIEERALNEALPDQYPAYSTKTARLIPGIY